MVTTKNVVIAFRAGSAHRGQNGSLTGAVRTAVGNAARLVARTLEVMSTRRDLVEVDDRTLQDLGISRAQANFEASRPVWDLAPQPLHRRWDRG